MRYSLYFIDADYFQYDIDHMGLTWDKLSHEEIKEHSANTWESNDAESLLHSLISAINLDEVDTDGNFIILVNNENGKKTMVV